MRSKLFVSKTSTTSFGKSCLRKCHDHRSRQSNIQSVSMYVNPNNKNNKFLKLLASTKHEEDWQNPVWLTLLYSSLQCTYSRLLSEGTSHLPRISPDYYHREYSILLSTKAFCFLCVVLQDSNYYASATLLNSYPSSSSRSVDREGGLAICT